MINLNSSLSSFVWYSYCLNNPLRYSDPSGMLPVPLDFNTDLNHNPEGSAFLANYYSSQNHGGLEGSAGEGTNRPYYYYDKNEKVYKDKNGKVVDGNFYINYIAPNLVQIEVKSSDPSLPSIRVTFIPIRTDYSGLNQKIEMTALIFGGVYSSYNFVQTYYNNWTNPTYTWVLENKGLNGNFYYNDIQIDDFSDDWHRKGSQGYFQDTPNDYNFFEAEWTLCGYKNGKWSSIGTYSWGYNPHEPNLDPYFVPSTNSIKEHRQNVADALSIHNKLY